MDFCPRVVRCREGKGAEDITVNSLFRLPLGQGKMAGLARWLHFRVEQFGLNKRLQLASIALHYVMYTIIHSYYMIKLMF